MLKRAGSPDNVILWNIDSNNIIIEVIIEFVGVHEVHSVPAKAVIKHGNTRIEVSKEVRGGVDHPFPITLKRYFIMPCKRHLHGVVWRQWFWQPNPLSRDHTGIVLPIHG